MAADAGQIVSNNPTGSIFNTDFLKGAAERAIKTGAQAVTSVLGVDVVENALQVNALELDYRILLGVFLGGLLSSFLTSVANPQFVAGTHKQLLVPMVEATRPMELPTGAGAARAGEPDRIQTYEDFNR